MMRTIKIISILAAALLSLAGCSKALDSVRPKDKIPSDQLNEADLDKLTAGILYKMEGLLNSFWWDGDYLGENFGDGPGFTYQDFFGDIVDPNADTPSSRWKTGFNNLHSFNEVYQSALAASDQNAEVVRTAKGTALFCRAYTYYILVIRFGNLPVIVKPTTDVTPFAIGDEAKVWKQIEEDLLAACDFLPEFSSPFYPSKEACWTLLSKVYLWTKDYPNAVIYADKVLDNSILKLSQNSNEFANMFCYGNTSNEIIFSLANKRTSSQIRLFTTVNDTDASFNYSLATNLRTSLFADTAEKAGDIRKDPTFNPAYELRIIKFPNGGKDMGQFVKNEGPSQSPIMVFRLADVYLTKAEAQSHTSASDAIATLTEFMGKRYATVTLPSTMEAKALENLILDENNREFVAEGHRWFDIKRTGRTDLLQQWNGRDHLLYWPIPQDQRDLANADGNNNYPQNPGY